MPFFFDYIYYRLTKAYFTWDGREGSTAIMAISMIQALVLIDGMLLLVKLQYDRSITSLYVPEAKIAGAILILTLIVSNYFKYRKKYNQFRRLWQQESPLQRRLKGMGVLLALLLPWVPLLLMGVYW